VNIFKWEIRQSHHFSIFKNIFVNKFVIIDVHVDDIIYVIICYYRKDVVGT
jgi:hypothetical protein